MHKLKLMIILLISGHFAFAQYDQKAYEILEEMSAKYKNIPAFKAKIIYSLVNESEGVSEKFEGKITVSGDKYHLEMDEQEIVTDGETIWTYLPDVNEVSIDNYNPDDSEITPSKIYDAYKKGFKYLYLEDAVYGNEVFQIVDLVPEDAKNKQYYKIRLEINKDTKSLSSWTMFDKAGNRYIYNILDFNSSIKPDAGYFTFDVSKYNGIEVIDLR